MEMRQLMRIVESAGATTPDFLAQQKEQLLPGLTKNMDSRSVAVILEMSYDDDEEELASAWFDVCLNIFKHIAKAGKVPAYRHMMVEDFDSFIQSLKDGTGRLGQYWSINPDIESPTWKQDQKGDVPVVMEGIVAATQIDWLQTLSQNFEWPHEGELIFEGDVRVLRIENGDTNQVIKPNASFPR